MNQKEFEEFRDEILSSITEKSKEDKFASAVKKIKQVKSLIDNIIAKIKDSQNIKEIDSSLRITIECLSLLDAANKKKQQAKIQAVLHTLSAIQTRVKEKINQELPKSSPFGSKKAGRERSISSSASAMNMQEWFAEMEKKIQSNMTAFSKTVLDDYEPRENLWQVLRTIGSPGGKNSFFFNKNSLSCEILFTDSRTMSDKTIKEKIYELENALVKELIPSVFIRYICKYYHIDEGGCAAIGDAILSEIQRQGVSFEKPKKIEHHFTTKINESKLHIMIENFMNGSVSFDMDTEKLADTVIFFAEYDLTHKPTTDAIEITDLKYRVEGINNIPIQKVRIILADFFKSKVQFTPYRTKSPKIFPTP